MRNQEIKEIKIKDLKLWSENPRDPLESETSDFEIIKNAILNKSNKWDLGKLMKQIGDFYDFSELPIVVKVDKQYIVYDGNRRLSIIKYLQEEAKFNKAGAKLLHKNKHEFLSLQKIPCNVCTVNIALDNIQRKHTDNGTWNELERDYFKHIHRNEDKSLFIKIDEATKIISDNARLNKGYVKDEILSKSNLENIGIGLDDDNEISTIYDKEFTKEIIKNIVNIIITKEITTRKNRGKLKEVLQNYNLSENLNVFTKAAKKFTLNEVYDDSLAISNIQVNSTTGGSSTSGSSTSGSSTSGSSTSGSSTGRSSTGGSYSSDSYSSDSYSSDSYSSDSYSSDSSTRASSSGASSSEESDTNTNNGATNKNRTPIQKNENLIFGGKLILKSGKVNDLYRAIEYIYESSNNNDVILPIIGMSLRLVLELTARTYYEDINDPLQIQDQILNPFLKMAKKDVLNQQQINLVSMTKDWLDDKISLDGVLGKYAHGNFIVDRGNILKTSIIVGQILEFYQGRK